MAVVDDTEPGAELSYLRPLPPHINVNSSTDATFLSCTFPLPNSSIVSSFSFVTAIPHPENLCGHHPIVFIRRYSSTSPVDLSTYIYTYVAINPIGFSKKSIMVYKAVMFLSMVSRFSSGTYGGYQGKFYALKVDLDDDYDPKSISMLRQQVRRSYYARKECCHDNLLGISTSFVDEQSKKFCVVVDLHDPGSIRTIMKNRFPQGVPENLILSVLRSVLKALKSLHKKHITHTDINAGHIYLSVKSVYDEVKDHVIKLGFGASVYDDDDDDEKTSYLPMASMSEWAAAPEVYYGNQSNYSKKADIWLVGITALELAYGGLKVSNRYALEEMIKDISSLHPAGQNPAKMMFKSCVKKLMSKFDDEEELVLPLLSSNSEDRCPLLFSKFSKSFIQMVMQCLTWDKKKRPSVDRLLSHPFFRNNLWRNDGQYFYDALMKKR